MEFIQALELPFFLILKGVLIIFLALYIIFAGVVIKQVRIMTDTLEVGMEGAIRALAFFHFIFAVAVLLLAIIIL